MRKYDDLIALLREADADECNEAASAIEALLAERESFYMDYRLKCDEETKRLTVELERERVRLAACGVVALANTPDSAKKARAMRPDYLSDSLDLVADAVDREMALRAENERLQRTLNDHLESESWETMRADRMRSERDALLAENEGLSRQVDVAKGMIEILGKERDAALIDARRYRWLRGSMSVPRHSSRWSRWEVRYWNGTVWDTMFCERMDAAIDAAMGATGES